MAIQDILRAITADADQRIATATSEHALALRSLKDRLANQQQEAVRRIQGEAEQHTFYLRTRAEAQAAMQVRHAVLACKQSLVEQVYADVLTALTALPTADTEALLLRLLKRVPGPGTLHPAQPHLAFIKKHVPAGCTVADAIAAPGGFRFVSDQYDVDLTYPSLIKNVLRPATELEASHQLFSA